MTNVFQKAITQKQPDGRDGEGKVWGREDGWVLRPWRPPRTAPPAPGCLLQTSCNEENKTPLCCSGNCPQKSNSMSNPGGHKCTLYLSLTRYEMILWENYFERQELPQILGAPRPKPCPEKSYRLPSASLNATAGTFLKPHAREKVALLLAQGRGKNKWK